MTDKDFLEFHACPGYGEGGFYTVHGFISCECETVYAVNEAGICPNCGRADDENPDAMLEECIPILPLDTVDVLISKLTGTHYAIPLIAQFGILEIGLSRSK